MIEKENFGFADEGDEKFQDSAELDQDLLHQWYSEET